MFDHYSKSQHSIDSCIFLNINCSLLSCFNTMELIKYSKYTSKKLPSIVQHSHVRTWSLPQVPPSAYVAQCAASASLILIWWFDYSHTKTVAKFPNSFPTCSCQFQSNDCCRRIIILSVASTYFEIYVVNIAYECSRYTDQFFIISYLQELWKLFEHWLINL